MTNEEHYEYARNGTCCVFMAFEPLAGNRIVSVRKRRTKLDYAQFMSDLVKHYKGAASIRLVQDNLNTHTAASFYDAFPPDEAFNLANKFWLAGIFSAVNESTWEHLKLAAIPAILWAILERKIFKLKIPNFLFAKTIGIYLMPVLIVIFFYGYKAILGDHNLFFDIFIFFLAVIIGQIVSYKIMMLPEFSRKANTVSLLLLIILLLIFIVFTFYPLHFFLLQDPISGRYGIIE